MAVYQYLIIDDQDSEREELAALVEHFNKSDETQKYFEATFGESITLNLLRSRNGRNEDYKLFRDILKADIVFLDLHFGNETDMGLDLLRLSQNNNELVRSIVVLTDVIENLNKETYKNLLGQLAKPMKLVDLVNNIVSFHISKRNIKAVYGSNHVTIMNGIAARKPVINQTEEVLNDINGETIYYDDILCIKTGARDVVLYLRNRETRTFNTNILTMVKIENSTKPDENTPGNIRKINNRLAINLNATWTQRYVLQIGDSAYLPEFHRWLLDNNVQFEDLRISDAFKEIRAILPNYNQ